MIDADGVSIFVNQGEGRTAHLFCIRCAAAFHDAFRQSGFPGAEITGQGDYRSFRQESGETATQILRFFAGRCCETDGKRKFAVQIF